MCRTTASTWRSSAATPRATGRSAISGDRSATRRAPGSTISQPARRRSTPRLSRRASIWKRRLPSNARPHPARRCACRCRWRNSAAFADALARRITMDATSSPPPLAGEGQGGGTENDRAFRSTPSPALPRKRGREQIERVARDDSVSTLRAGAALHIGDALRHAELAAADLGEDADALADRRHRGTGEAEPQPALAISLVGRPIRARIDGDASGERGLSEFYGVDRVGELYPQKNAALGRVEFGGGA